MSVNQVRNVDFGTYYSGIASGVLGVGYTLLNENGTVYQARSTVGVYNSALNSGIYAAILTFPDLWSGTIVWDTGSTVDPVGYASEEYHSTLEYIRDMTAGKWKIINDQMIFYKEDNITEVARFNLFDENGLPTVDVPTERRKV
jgi:hypothetical protein